MVDMDDLWMTMLDMDLLLKRLDMDNMWRKMLVLKICHLYRKMVRTNPLARISNAELAGGSVFSLKISENGDLSQSPAAGC